MKSTSHRRWLAAAGVAVAAAVAPQAAFASDDYAIYNSRSQFESALGASHTRAPSGSGVSFGTSKTAGSISAPIVYAPGAAGNLFGSSTESVGYTFTPGFLGLGQGSLMMTLPSGVTAFGFDYAYNPATAGEGATFEGRFCNSFFGCDSDVFKVLSGGSGFVGVIAKHDIQGVTVKGTAKNLQVANFTFAGPGDVTVTPEPGTIALLGTGLAALAGFGMARRRKQAVES